MKKIISFLLAICICISACVCLGACNENDDVTPNSTNNNSSNNNSSNNNSSNNNSSNNNSSNNNSNDNNSSGNASINDSNNSNSNNDTSATESNSVETKYNQALVCIANKEYSDAYDLLRQITAYEPAKKLLEHFRFCYSKLICTDIDHEGNETSKMISITYTSKGNILRESDAYNFVREYTYDSNDNLKKLFILKTADFAKLLNIGMIQIIIGSENIFLTPKDMLRKRHICITIKINV